MAASLESLDQIRDSLINRGIGNSGLTTQAIQRANLPDLSSALATARSIQANELEARNAQLRAKQLRDITRLNKNTAHTLQEFQTPSFDKVANVGLTTVPTPFGSGGRIEPVATGVTGVFSGDLNQFVEDLKRNLGSTSGSSAVKLQESTGGINPTLDSVLDQLRSLITNSGLRIL